MTTRPCSTKASPLSAAALVVVLLVAYWLTANTGQVAVTHATTLPAAVVLGEAEPTSGVVLVPVVKTEPANRARVLLCHLRNDCPTFETIPDDVGAGSFASSLADAAAAVDSTVEACGNVPPETVLPAAVRVTGPSGGLAWAVHWAAQCGDGELLHGHAVSATGALDSDGRVSSVTGIVAKVQAARQAGADLILVPAAQGQQFADQPDVHPVGTLAAAIRAIASH